MNNFSTIQVEVSSLSRTPRRRWAMTTRGRTSTLLLLLLTTTISSLLTPTIQAYNHQNGEADDGNSGVESSNKLSPSSFPSDILSNLADGDYNSVNQDDDSSNPLSATFSTPLSCFVCSTVGDMRCKYLNHSELDFGVTDPTMLDAFGTDPTEEDNPELDRAIELGNLRSHVRAVSLATYDTIDFNNDAQQRQHATIEPDYDEHQRSSQSDIYPESDVALISMEEAHQAFGAQCSHDEHYCIVRRMGVSSLDPGSKVFNFFGLQRGCAKHCQPGCFIIGNGERTKLSFCTACCTSDYCNVGNRASSPFRYLSSSLTNVVILLLTTIAAVSIVFP